MSEESLKEDAWLRGLTIRQIDKARFYAPRSRSSRDLGELILGSTDLTTPRISAAGIVDGGAPAIPSYEVSPTPGYGNTPDAMDVKGFTSQVNATNASQLLLPADPNRKFLMIVNDDALGYVRISWGVDATLVTGIKLSANGGGILLDNNVPTAALYIIGSIPLNSNITLVSA